MGKEKKEEIGKGTKGGSEGRKGRDENETLYSTKSNVTILKKKKIPVALVKHNASFFFSQL